MLKSYIQNNRILLTGAAGSILLLGAAFASVAVNAPRVEKAQTVCFVNNPGKCVPVH